MKRNILLLLIIALASVLITAGCTKKAKKIDNEALEKEYENAPEWVLTSHSGDGLSAVGNAKIGKGGIQFARTEALANARSELARQISVKVKGLVSNFAQQTGVDTGQTLDSFSKQVSKLVTDETIAGSRQEDMWISPSSDLFVLVVMEVKNVKDAIKREVTSSYQQDNARWQQFKAKDGDRELDEEIEKAFQQMN